MVCHRPPAWTHIVSPAGLWAALAQTSLLGKWGLRCPELDFFPAACLSNLVTDVRAMSSGWSGQRVRLRWE